MIPSNQLSHFYHVVRTGSIRKAARYLNKSQSTVSSAIKLLEDDLGCQLLVRSSNASQLTEKGQQLFRFAENFLQASDLLREDLRWDYSAEKVLRIGINKHYDELCTPLIERFVVAYPDVEIQVHFTDGEFLRREFRNGDLDVIVGINFNLAGFATDELPCDSILIMQDAVRLSCSKKHPLANRNDLQISELQDYAFILPSFYQDPVKQFFRSKQVPLRVRAIMNHARISARLLLDTQCLSLLAPGTLPAVLRSELAFPEFSELDLGFQILIRFQSRTGLEALVLDRFKTLASEWVAELSA